MSSVLQVFGNKPKCWTHEDVELMRSQSHVRLSWMLVEDPADSPGGSPRPAPSSWLRAGELRPGEANTDVSNMTMIILCLSWMHPSWYIRWTVSMLKVCCDEIQSAAARHDALISQSSGSEAAACDWKLNIETLASSLCICVGPQSVSPPGPVGAHPRAHLRDRMRDCTQRWWEVKFNWAIRRSSTLLCECDCGAFSDVQLMFVWPTFLSSGSNEHSFLCGRRGGPQLRSKSKRVCTHERCWRQTAANTLQTLTDNFT